MIYNTIFLVIQISFLLLINILYFKIGIENMNLQGQQLLSYIELCSNEIKELHLFFENWFTGNIENNSHQFSRFTNSIGDFFFLIPPRGGIIKRNEIIEIVKSNYGQYHTNPNDFKIWIKNINFQYVIESSIILTYEEWQRIGKETQARLSSAVFNISNKEDNKNEIMWLHVHEVTIPI
ncbi:MAG: hypothetical protein HeimC3_04170 [Candidatus Heimdallarchaeota archaeon LC_3]|nr:MAG: hypothetical protein HeimC3_04170 [Candidatus Heimdallarchaeota archaeon LC_3]